MPITKKADQTSINDSDKKTMHNAGIDLPSSDSSSDDADTTAPETVVDIDGGVPSPSDPDLQKTGIHFFDSNKDLNKTDLSSLAEEKMKSANSKDLEAEFESQLGTFKSPSKDTAKIVGEKSKTMSGLLAKIQAKLGLKKNKVKEELGSLKKMKEGISQDISDIKELEESEEKIQAELQKIDTITEEMEAIEKEVDEELKR